MIKLFTYYLMFFILSHKKATEKNNWQLFLHHLWGLTQTALGIHKINIGDLRKKLWGFTKETMGTNST